MSETTVTTTEQTTVVETVEQTVVIQVITPEGTELVETEQGTTVVEVFVQGPQGPPGEGADVLTQSITNGDTTHAPSGDAVFDALAVQTAATAAVAADLAAHEADTANPHATTAAQVGADATGTAAAAIAAHVAAGDPHPGYLLESAVDTDGTLAANSDARVPSQKAVKTYADSLIAANDAMQLKGVIDCSANPNYPAADAGHTYRVSVAGKIGGASGVTVEAGDILLCLADSTASGNHATVGTSWTVVQVNIIGALTTSDIGSTVQAYDATLAALAAANWAANTLPIGSGADTVSQVSFAANTFPARASTGNLVAKTITDDGLSLVAAANYAAMRTALGLGTAATQNTGTSGATLPFLDGTNTWAGQNTFAAGTITTSQPFTITQTWNSGSTAFGAFKINVTDPASASGSLLADLQVGGTSKIVLTKAGKVQATTDANAPTHSFIGQTTTGTGYFNSGVLFWAAGYYPLHLQGSAAKFASNVSVGWTSITDSTIAADTSLVRVIAKVVGVRDGSTGGGALGLIEMTAPAAPSANGVYVYAEDNGAGKTRLMAIFPSGAAQQVAIEP